MKVKSVQFVVIVALVLGVVLAACAPAATPTPKPAAPTPKPLAPTAVPAKKLTFALVTKGLNNPFWEMMRSGAQKVCDAKGIEMIYLAPTVANNVEEQTRLVDDLIAKKVDGFVLVPVDSTAMVPAIERVNAAGIPLALANTNANGGKRITFAAIQNYDAMLLVAEYMAKAMN